MNQLLREVFARLQTKGGVAAFIASVTTLTVLGIFIAGREIPELLAHAWMTILGFYFGVVSSMPDAGPSPPT